MIKGIVFNDTTYTWEEALEKSFKREIDVPYEVLKLTVDNYKEFKNPYSITSLLTCSRAVYLEKTTEIYLPIQEIYWMFRGWIFHNTLAKTYGENAIVETEFSFSANNFVITGIPDCVLKLNDKLILIEYKTVQGLPLSPFLHHLAQINGYYWLLHENGLNINMGEIYYFSGGGARKFKIDNFWNIEDTKRLFISEAEKLLKYFTEKTMPPPRPKEEWQCRYCSYFRKCQQLRINQNILTKEV